MALILATTLRHFLQILAIYEKLHNFVQFSPPANWNRNESIHTYRHVYLKSELGKKIEKSWIYFDLNWKLSYEYQLHTALGGAKGQKTLYSDNLQKKFFSHQNLPPSLIFWRRKKGILDRFFFLFRVLRMLWSTSLLSSWNV